MATMNREIYEALKEANVSEDKALKAAESVATFDARFARIEAEMAVLKWMVGTNIAISLAVLWRLLK
ncbi:MAG: integrase [Hyphomicrobiaceae bacterium]|nr:MAG: integrase [Hyphomicrobiaceae bacterium]